MADATSPQQQLGFGFAVEDEASKPLGDIERAYISLTKTMDKTMREIAKTMNNFSDRLNEAGEAAQDAGEEEEKQTDRLQEADKALKKNILGLDQLGLSWNKLIGVLTAVSVGAVIIGLVGFFKKAFDAAVKFRSEMAKLNEVYSLSRKEGREVSSTILSLAGRAGKTRDEVMSMTRAMLDIGLTPRAAKAAGTSFRALAKVTLDLSAATGVSAESAANLTDQLIRINKVPANNIRNIGFSIKNVADQTRITTDELINFNQSLEPIFANLQDQSSSARAQFTQEMVGIAGALSDVGIDATKATSQFAEMLDETSAEGQKALGQLASFTGRSTTELKELIKNDPTAVFDQLAKSAGRMDPSQLKLMARSLEPLGLGFSELTRLSDKFGKAGSKSFRATVDEITKLSAKDNALAEAAQKRQDRIEGITTRFGRIWENVMIQIGGAISDKMIGPLMKRAMPLVKRFAKFLRGIDWDDIFQTLFDTIDAVIAAFNFIAPKVGAVLDFIGEAIGLAMSNIVSLVEATTELFSGNWEKAGRIVISIFDNIIDFYKRHFGPLLKFIAAPFIKAFDFVRNTIDEVLVYIGNEVAPMLEKVAKFIPGGETIVDALKSAGRSAETRIQEREEQARVQQGGDPRGSTVTQAVQPGQSPSGTQLQAPALNMPSRMTTADPAAQQLLKENNQYQKDIRDELRRRNRGGGAAAVKAGVVRANAGT